MQRLSLISFCIALVAAAPVHLFAQEPDLPPGLATPEKRNEAKEQDEPLMPMGLGDPEPALPTGLGAETENERIPEDATETDKRPSFISNVTGFLESRIGPRLLSDPNQGAFTIGEARLRLESQWEPGDLTIRFAGDAIYDEVVDRRSPNLETGEGAFDLREANVVWRPLDFVDVKAGRQILTWGVGDLIFINDLFPKDFQSFFIGRDEEYLKAPSDAVRVSLFHDLANVDLVYTPRFDADRFIDGSRLSYFNPVAGGVVGEDIILDPIRPDDWFADDEFAGRLYRQVGTFEVAAYGYIGFFKGPSGLLLSGDFFFPRLSVYGASLRGPFQGGILTAEFGRYLSRDDPNGDNPLVPNGNARFLVGYEREIVTELTAAAQYYVQLRSDQDAFLATLPQGARRADEARHLLTVRLTKLMMNQNLTLSAFNFWSPNEHDGHFRMRASYKLSDDWLVETGGNIFYGPRNDVFFSQLNDNTNLFVAVRRSF